MHIFITGATGLIGSELVQKLLIQDHKISILTRNIASAKRKFGNLIEYFDDIDFISFEHVDAIINLAGESIGSKRWTKTEKLEIINSRLDITKKIANKIISCENPPKIFISGSAIGYYGNQQDTIISEQTIPSDGFTHRLCKEWEHAATKTRSALTRVCLLRTAIVLGAQGGILSKIIPLFKIGLGCVMGNGKQYISWIHIKDMVGIICFLINTDNAQGAFNISAPEPVTNKLFSKKLAKALQKPCIFKIPAFILRIIIGEGSVLLLDSQRASSKKLQNLGYSFLFPDLTTALKDIFKNS